MSYHSWTNYGYGVCVDDINTTPERLLKLAALNPKLLADVREYLDDYFGEFYKDEDLTMDYFNELEGDYCERGVAYVLYNVIKDEELQVAFCDDYNGTPYILYMPTYPWYFKEHEKNLTEDDVREIFTKYIRILTDENVVIDYYEVENGG